MRRATHCVPMDFSVTRRASSLVAGAIISLVDQVGAQSASPDVVARDTAGAVAEAPSWSRWPGAPLRFSVPSLEPRFDVVVTTPISRAWLAAHDNPRAVARGCRGLDVVARDTTLGESFIDWEDAERGTSPIASDATEIANAVVITIAVIAPTESPCRGYPARSAGSIAAGVAFQHYGSHDPGGDVVHASLLVNGVSRPALRVERGRQRVIVPKGAATTASTPSIVRLLVRPEDFAVDTSGRLNAIQIAVAGGDGVPGTFFALPFAVRRQVHQDLLARSIVRSTGDGMAPRLALRQPREARLRRGIELELAGDTRAAALLYHASLYDLALGDEDRRQARVRLALALAALGDSSGARGVADQVVGSDPCFTLASSFPVTARTLFRSEARAGARCSHDIPGVLARSLLFPGLGHRHVGRRAAGLGVSLATGIAFGYAAQRYASSRTQYDRYVAANNAFDARKWYGRASSSRDDARRAALLGAAVWAAGAMEATISEIGHLNALRAVREYGGIRVTTAPLPGGFGIAIGRE